VFLVVPAHPGSPLQRAVKRLLLCVVFNSPGRAVGPVCVCVCVCARMISCELNDF